MTTRRGVKTKLLLTVTRGGWVGTMMAEFHHPAIATLIAEVLPIMIAPNEEPNVAATAVTRSVQMARHAELPTWISTSVKTIPFSITSPRSTLCTMMMATPSKKPPPPPRTTVALMPLTTTKRKAWARRELLSSLKTLTMASLLMIWTPAVVRPKGTMVMLRGRGGRLQTALDRACHEWATGMCFPASATTVERTPITRVTTTMTGIAAGNEAMRGTAETESGVTVTVTVTVIAHGKMRGTANEAMVLCAVTALGLGTARRAAQSFGASSAMCRGITRTIAKNLVC
mmetsp:Transcript_7350/g.18864  ORF Transcript_7350/g.18864 Transcript_7350/m.18864 type:complete len:286 (-) Transcript_7350:264-1121(-)